LSKKTVRSGENGPNEKVQRSWSGVVVYNVCRRGRKSGEPKGHWVFLEAFSVGEKVVSGSEVLLKRVWKRRRQSKIVANMLKQELVEGGGMRALRGTQEDQKVS